MPGRTRRGTLGLRRFDAVVIERKGPIVDKSPDAMRTISEASDELDLPQHVLRFWETRFAQVKPLKRNGGRRFYRPDDIELLRAIRHLLYSEGYTIKGVQKLLLEQGPRGLLAAVGLGGAPANKVSAVATAVPTRLESLPVAPRAPLAPALRQKLDALRQQLRECERLLDLARKPATLPLRKAS